MALGAGLLLAGFACGGGEHAAPIHKVLLISVDTLRADYLGTYNPLLDTSPNIDRLARRSFVFDDAIAQSTSTLPSHTALVYSLHTFVHRAYHSSPAQPLLESPVQDLQRAGFATGALVGGGQLREAFGFNRGFDVYEDITTTYVPGNPPHEDRLARLLGEATDFLRRHRDEDVFLLVHNYAVHYPHYAPAEYLDRYTQIARAAGVGIDAEEGAFTGTSYRGEPEPAVGTVPEEPDAAWYLATPYRISYAALVRYVDDFIGGLLDSLEELGIADETLIVLLSDHGESLGEHGQRGHGTFVPEVLQVPLVIHVPGLEGRRIEAPVQLIDVMPTIYGFLGREPPYPFMGADLSPALLGAGAGPAPDRLRFSENRASSTQEDLVAVLQGDWKLTFRPDDPETVELYDIGVDPAESRNLADARGPVVARMVGAYDALVRSGARLRALFPRAGVEIQDLDPETLLELRALGYIQ